MTRGQKAAEAAQNLRYLLWREKIDRSRWAEHVAGVVDCDAGHAEALLDYGALTPHEGERVAEHFCVAEEELRFGQFAREQIDVLQENIRYLVGTLDHGEKKHLAEAVNVHPVTVSRWLSGAQGPESAKLAALCRYFGLPDDTDLRSEPIFLSRLPASDRERREWLRERVDALSPRSLRELFPALQRLLKDA